MTNVKPITPFCVDMSKANEDEIRELHKMCLYAGFKPYESCEYWIKNKPDYNFMGVDEDSDIVAFGDSWNFDENIINFDQARQHLTLSPQTSVGAPLKGFNTPLDESHTECVKHTVWTPTCFKEGIPYQVGMQVGLCGTSKTNGHHVTVTAIGKSNVLVDVEEWCVSKDRVIPYEEVVLSQRDKVMAYLEQEFDEEDSSTIYNEILKLGVFKEDGEYESM